MNSFVNAVLLFLLFPIMLFTIVVGFDIPVEFLKTTGQFIPYISETFLIAGLIVAIINIRRSVKRWTGVFLLNKEAKYKWIKPISTERKKRVYVYNLMEGTVFLAIAWALFKVSNLSLITALAFCIPFFDNLIFTIAGMSKPIWKIGVTSKALVHADREVNVIYFKGLVKVESHLDALFFEYTNGLRLYIPTNCISENDLAAFYSVIENQVDTNKVFFINTKK
jgi:hypothetical protein